MSHPLFPLLWRLEAAGIHFSLGRHREDTVLVTLTLVGERVEVEVFEDGHMEISRFTGDEAVVGGAELLDKLIDESLQEGHLEISQDQQDLLDQRRARVAEGAAQMLDWDGVKHSIGLA